MSIFKVRKKTIKPVAANASTEEPRGETASGGKEIPADAKYRIGDIIHAAGSRVPLGDLKVIDIKAGGYAIVYIVVSEPTATRFALKTFQDWCLESQHEVERFHREAEAWIRLEKHPNIVYAHSVFNLYGRPHILLEYVGGSDLWERMRGRQIPVRDTLRYAIQLCRGMMHAQVRIPGFTHRDIKPTNCLITADDVLKITDFGQLKITGVPRESAHNGPVKIARGRRAQTFDTPAGHWGAGTPPYMAPEQFDAVNETGIRSDIYSFGNLLFEMLTAVRLFDAESHEECRRQHMTVVPPDPVSLNPQIPRPLADLILRCLAKSPDGRPRDFEVLESELGGILWDLHREKIPPDSAAELTVEELAGRGVSLATLGRHDEALVCLDRVLDANPHLALAWNCKGQVALTLERHQEALGCFERALALDPDSSLARANKGVVLSRLARYEDALICFDKVLDMDAGLAFVWREKGHTLERLGWLNKARMCLNRALMLDPRQVEAHHDLGLTCQKLGRHEECVEAYSNAIRLNPRYAEAHNNLGRAYADAGRLKEAIKSYQRAINLKPDYAAAHRNLGDAYRQLAGRGGPLLGEIYAELILAFLLDCVPSLDQKEPVYVIELGGGAANLAFYLLRELLTKKAFYDDLSSLKIRYVLTSPAEGDVRRWKADEKLQALEHSGALDFAVFRPETDRYLFPPGDQTGPGIGPTRNPVIAIANNLFSSMAQDLFRVGDQGLERVIPAGQEAVQVGSDDTLTPGQQKQGENHAGLDGFYADPGLNRILRAYQARPEGAGLVFPIGAFNCIQNLQALSGDKLALLSTDRASGTAEGQSDDREQPYAVNGSFFSNTINYHAINRYFEDRGGFSFVSRDETTGHVMAMNVILSPAPRRLEQTRYRFQQVVRHPSVTDCLCNSADLLDLSDDDPHHLSFKSCVALLELTAYDPNVFCRLGEKLYDALKGIDDRRLTGLLVRTLTRIRENIYIVDREHNAYFWLGKMYYRLRLYDECLESFRQSVELLGPDAQALYFIGACSEVKEEYEPALNYYKQSLLFNPNWRLSSDAVKRMEARLEEQATHAESGDRKPGPEAAIIDA